MEEQEDDQAHLNPQAPPIKHHNNIISNKQSNTTNNQKPTSKCLVYTLLIIVLQSIAFLIFGLVVLHVKTPTLRLSNAVVNNLNHGPTWLNMTVIAQIRLRNMNFGGFKYRQGKAILSYENATIGTGNIYEGRVGSRDYRDMNVSLDVNYYMNFSGINNNNNNNNSNNNNNNNSIGNLGNFIRSLRSFADVRGEVRVLKMINRRRGAVMNCTMDLNLTSLEIQGLLCQ